jgi:hypothetical protein
MSNEIGKELGDNKIGAKKMYFQNGSTAKKPDKTFSPDSGEIVLYQAPNRATT